MWSSWFGTTTTPSCQKLVATPIEKNETVYLVQGTLRVPLEFPPAIGRNVCSLRQWVFKQLSSLPDEENVEYYTFKELPSNYVYWYSLYESKRDKGDTSGSVGILMKINPTTGAFTGITDQAEEVPQVHPPKQEVPQQDKDIFVDEHKNNTSGLAAPAANNFKECEIKISHRPKRNRTKK